jgi:hypothetical protein
VTPVLSRNLVDCKINRFNIFAVNFTGPGMEFSILHSCTAFIESNCFCIALQEDRVKGQPGARSRKVHGSIRPFGVLCMQSFYAFLQEAVSKKIESNCHVCIEVIMCDVLLS